MAHLTDEESEAARLEAVAGPGGETVLKLSGEIDISTVPTLQASLTQALGPAPERVVMDLSDVEFMDSSGIAFLLTAGGAPTALEIRRPSAVVRRLIELSGLGPTLRLSP